MLGMFGIGIIELVILAFLGLVGVGVVMAIVLGSNNRGRDDRRE